jgi:hypothetical protein
LIALVFLEMPSKPLLDEPQSNVNLVDAHNADIAPIAINHGAFCNRVFTVREITHGFLGTITKSLCFFWGVDAAEPNLGRRFRAVACIDHQQRYRVAIGDADNASCERFACCVNVLRRDREKEEEGRAKHDFRNAH